MMDAQAFIIVAPGHEYPSTSGFRTGRPGTISLAVSGNSAPKPKTLYGIGNSSIMVTHKGRLKQFFQFIFYYPFN
jgi:hypothetical protein